MRHTATRTASSAGSRAAPAMAAGSATATRAVLGAGAVRGQERTAKAGSPAAMHRCAVSSRSASGYCRGMITRRGLLACGAGAIAFAQSDDEIRRILSDRIERDRQALGIVAAVVDAQARRVITQGDVKPDSLFQIGSVTKVFTALLLADMVERGEVALRDRVSKYLPEGVKVPQRGPRPITLEDLATHMSGLPRVPTNLSPKNLLNPYVGYTA